ncbi:MAG: DUF2283 domain-containing protein [Planctomycetota bacterium]|nr:DUF2283 domain-containing protein [Planctomycetota bacterium]
MKGCYFEITYRDGRPLAAYLYLPRQAGDTSARTVRAAHGLLVDWSADGRPIGIEILSPARLTLEQLNDVLAGLSLQPLAARDLPPTVAA